MSAKTAEMWIAAAVGLAGLGGCPSSGGGNGFTGTSELSGSWSGTLSCEVTQSLEGVEANPTQTTRQLSIAFNDSSVPSSLLIPGFTSAPDQTVSITQVGESQTVTSTSGDLSITAVVTVSQASYAATSARIVLSIQYTAQGGGLSQTGTATQTIQVSVSGADLSYSATTTYTIVQAAGLISLNTGEETVCQGTLQAQ